jgi:putative transposase
MRAAMKGVCIKLTSRRGILHLHAGTDEHAIRDDTDFEQHVDYIHYNPVKHGLVARVTDWPFSSFHRYVAQGILPGDWAGDASELSGRFGE